MKYSIFIHATLILCVGLFINPLSFSPSGDAAPARLPQADRIMQDTSLTAVDSIPPTAICKNITIQLDAEGEAYIAPSDVDGGSSDSCGIAAMSLNRDDFSCTDVSTFSKVVLLTVEDSSENSSSCQALVKVVDSLAPNAKCKNLTLNLDAFGGYKIAPSDVDNGSSDGCGIASMLINQDSFKCSDISPFSKVVTLSLVDVFGNDSSCQALIKLEDKRKPEVVCRDISVYLDSAGNYALAASEIDNGSSDNCGLDSVFMAPTFFSCNDVGSPRPVWLHATDIYANEDSCLAQISVLDSLSPQALCQSLTVYLDTHGSFSITASDIDNGSSDNCAIDTIRISSGNFDCSHTASPVMVRLWVEDIHANEDSCDVQITVRDTLRPSAQCQSLTVYLDAQGSYELAASEIENGSSDNCGIDAISIPPTSFDCSSVPTTIRLLVTDIHGNRDSCQAQLTIQDTLQPDAQCQAVTVYLDASGSYSLSPSEVNNLSDDNCGASPLSLAVSPATFDCSSVGTHAVTLQVSDASGNTASCQTIVTVADSILPDAFCQNLTVQLDSMGMADILPSDIDAGSSDACGIDTVFLDKYHFDCTDLQNSSQVLRLTTSDVNANSSSCQANVLIRDSIKPLVFCNTVILYLDELGQDTIQTVEAGYATDNCMLKDVAINQHVFSCIDLGNNSITFAAEDSSGNISFCNPIVEVRDTISPEVSCPPTEVVPADQNCQAMLTDFTNKVSPTDNCTAMPTVSQFPAVGSLLADTSLITLTVTDASNNTTACSFRFIVVDETQPEVLCKNITVKLDSSGRQSITPEDVLDSKTDNCSPSNLLSISIDRSQFFCSDVGNVQELILRVLDENDNGDSCRAYVTVVDEIFPSIVCPDSMEIDLGFADQVMSDVSLWDNCGISDVQFSEWNITCAMVAQPFALTVTAEDSSGNKTPCSISVTARDTALAVWLTQTPHIIRCGEQLIDWNEPSARFPCERTPLVSYNSQPAGLVKEGIFPVGLTTIFYELNDELVGNKLLYDFDIEILPIPIITNYSNGDEFVATSLKEFQLLPEADVEGVAYLWEVQLSEFLEASPELPAGMMAGPLAQTFSFTDPRSVGEALYHITPVFADSCIGESVEILVKVLPGSGTFFIPDMFTPNGDGVNDDWGVRLLVDGNPEDYKIKIFNQAGGLMYTGMSLDKRWDGGNAPDGPYWYIIERKATGERLQSGGVTIQR